MAHVVYVSSGLVGILNSGVELARRLRDAGHDVTFVGWRDICDQVNQQGFDCIRIDADQRARNRLRSHAAEVGRLRSIPIALRLRRELIQSTEIEDTLRHLDPDLLIIDVEVHTVLIASRSLDIPTLTRFDLPSVYRDWNTPPLHTDLDLPTGPRGRLRCRAAWVSMWTRRLWVNTLGQLRPDRAMARLKPFAYGTVSRHNLAQFARARGLRLRDFTSPTHWLAPHVYPAIPLITTTASELEMRVPKGPPVHHVGPMIHADHVDTRVGEADRRRWETFRDEATVADRAIVYCSLGTLNRDVLSRVRHVVAAAEGADWSLVIGLGGQAEAAQIGQLPEHVLVLDYAPQLEVLAGSTAAVVHGGINTINECLWSGVPMIVHRSGRVDQPGNASRIAHHGLGVRVDIDAGPDEVGRAVRRVLHDPAYAARVASMQASFAAYEGELERLVEQTLGISGDDDFDV